MDGSDHKPIYGHPLSPSAPQPSRRRIYQAMALGAGGLALTTILATCFSASQPPLPSALSEAASLRLAEGKESASQLLRIAYGGTRFGQHLEDIHRRKEQLRVAESSAPQQLKTVPKETLPAQSQGLSSSAHNQARGLGAQEKEHVLEDAASIYKLLRENKALIAAGYKHMEQVKEQLKQEEAIKKEAEQLGRRKAEDSAQSAVARIQAAEHPQEAEAGRSQMLAAKRDEAQKLNSEAKEIATLLVKNTQLFEKGFEEMAAVKQNLWKMEHVKQEREHILGLAASNNKLITEDASRLKAAKTALAQLHSEVFPKEASAAVPAHDGKATAAAAKRPQPVKKASEKPDTKAVQATRGKSEKNGIVGIDQPGGVSKGKGIALHAKPRPRSQAVEDTVKTDLGAKPASPSKGVPSSPDHQKAATFKINQNTEANAKANSPHRTAAAKSDSPARSEKTARGHSVATSQGKSEGLQKAAVKNLDTDNLVAKPLVPASSPQESLSKGTVSQRLPDFTSHVPVARPSVAPVRHAEALNDCHTRTSTGYMACIDRFLEDATSQSRRAHKLARGKAKMMGKAAAEALGFDGVKGLEHHLEIQALSRSAARESGKQDIRPAQVKRAAQVLVTANSAVPQSVNPSAPRLGFGDNSVSQTTVAPFQWLNPQPVKPLNPAAIPSWALKKAEAVGKGGANALGFKGVDGLAEHYVRLREAGETV